MNHKFYIFVFLILINLRPSYGIAGWELYDNFDQPNIDTQKWDIRDDSSASIISIENGRAKFYYRPGHPSGSSYLAFYNTGENIKGIRATVEIASCTGDVTGRVSGYVGKYEENHLLSTIQMIPQNDTIFAAVGLQGPAPSYQFFYDLYYGQFPNRIPILGKKIVVSTRYESDKLYYNIEGIGDLEFKLSRKASPTEVFFRIGAVSDKGEGPCTLYFDDIYVYRE